MNTPFAFICIYLGSALLLSGCPDGGKLPKAPPSTPAPKAVLAAPSIPTTSTAFGATESVRPGSA